MGIKFWWLNRSWSTSQTLFLRYRTWHYPQNEIRCICVPVPIPFHLRNVVLEQISRIWELDVIRKNASPWSSPILLVLYKRTINIIYMSFVWISRNWIRSHPRTICRYYALIDTLFSLPGGSWEGGECAKFSAASLEEAVVIIFGVGISLSPFCSGVRDCYGPLVRFVEEGSVMRVSCSRRDRPPGAEASSNTPWYSCKICQILDGFELSTDASNESLGAVLSQKGSDGICLSSIQFGWSQLFVHRSWIASCRVGRG